MFYVGNILWLEECERWQDIPDCDNFSGGVYFLADSSRRWYDTSLLQSPQNPITGEWLPAAIWADGEKQWRRKGLLYSFRNPVTGGLMPAIICANGRKEYWDEEIYISNPETYYNPNFPLLPANVMSPSSLK